MHVNTLLNIGYAGITVGDTFFDPNPYTLYQTTGTTEVIGLDKPVVYDSLIANYADMSDFYSKSNMVIPVGVTKVRLRAGLVYESHGGSISHFFTFYTNKGAGAERIPGSPAAAWSLNTYIANSPSLFGNNIESSIIDVTAGDIIYTTVEFSDGGTRTLYPGSFFFVEVIS